MIDNGNAIVKVDHYPHPMFGVISSSGTEIIPAEYYSLSYIREQDVFLANSEKVYKIQTNPHYIDTYGNTVILNADSAVTLPSKYLSGRSFSCGLAAVEKEYASIEESENLDDIDDDFCPPIDLEYIDYILFGGEIKKKQVTKTKYGFIDANGSEQIPCLYDAVSDFKYCLSIVTLNKKKGVINSKGDIVISLAYDDIEFLTETLFKVKNAGSWGVVSISEEIIIPLTYLAIGELSENLLAVKIPIEISNVSAANKLVHRRPRAFDPLGMRRSTLEPKRKWGFINLNNDVVVDCRYSEVRNFNDGLAAVKESTWKYIDANSNTIINLPATVTNVTDFNNGMATVTFSHGVSVQEHILLKTGNLLIENVEIKVNFDSISYIESFHEGLAKVLYESEWGFINVKGEMTIKGLPSEPTNFIDGISSYYYKGNQLNINVHGEIVIQFDDSSIAIPLEYSFAKALRNGLYVVERRSDHLLGIIDSNYKIIIPFQKHDLEIVTKENGNVYFNAIYPSKEDGFGIYYNIEGTRVVPCLSGDIEISSEYNQSSDNISCGLVAVSNKDSLWGFVDQDGVERIPCTYDSVTDFENGYSIVSKDYNKGVIDTFGNIVIKLGDFAEIKEISNGTWKVTHNNYGFDTTYQITDYDGYENREVTEHEWIPDVRNINSNGEILIPLNGKNVPIPSEYDWTDAAFHEGFLSVCKEGEWGIINTRLELVINCVYDEKFVFDNGIAFAHFGNVTDVIDVSGLSLFSGEYLKVNRYEEFNMFVCQSQNRDRFDIYDMLGNFKFSTVTVKSRIQIPNSQSLSPNRYNPSNIVPISNKYLKFSISTIYEERRIVLWGVCDNRGSVIINAKFDEIGGIGSGLLSVAKEPARRTPYNKETWGYSDLFGNMVVDFQYAKALPFINGLAKIIKKDCSGWGILTTNGEELTSCIYDKIEYTSNHEVIVSDYGDKTKKNIITEDGLIHLEYFVETNARGEGDGYTKDVYLRGYDWCSQFFHEHCIVQKDKAFGIVYNTGDVTFPLSEMKDVVIAVDECKQICFKKYKEYKSITTDGRIKTQKGGHIIDLPVGVHWCKEWKEDFIEVESFGKWGLMNSNLEMIIETKYDLVQYISHNYALCKFTDNDQSSFILINVLSGETINLPYHHCTEFENGCAIVSIITKENKSSWSSQTDYEYAYGLIDYSGKELLPCNYKQIQFRIPPKKESYYNYGYYDEPYSLEDSLMDALDGCEDAYWNID